MSLTREEKLAAAKVRMAEIAAKFIERSVGEVSAMRASFGQLSAGDPGALVDIRHFAHRMCGTGATLGFDPLSDCAMRIEQLADAQKAGVMPAAAALEQLGAAIDALDAELTRLRRG